MNYLELINLTLQELNFKTVSDMVELVKPDHKRIMTIVNRVNNITLESFPWQFMLREKSVDLPKHTSRLDLGEDLRIKSVCMRKKDAPKSAAELMYYNEEYERFLNNRAGTHEFSLMSFSLLVRPAEYDRTLDLLCLTKNHAIDAQGNEKRQLELADDQTLLPDEHAHILVFAACLQFKSNPEHPRYKYWVDQYVDARAALRASNEYIVPQPPALKLPLWALGYDNYRRIMGWR